MVAQANLLMALPLRSPVHRLKLLHLLGLVQLSIVLL